MKILVAADGSEYSRAAIDECCRMFEKSPDAEIEIVSVFELMIPISGPFIVSAEYVQFIDDGAEEQAKTIVAQTAAHIREKYPHLADKTTTKVLGGSPAQQILEEAENWGAELLVSGSHGYGLWKRAWMGSVSNALVHHAPCSVMVVRAKHQAQSAAAQ